MENLEKIIFNNTNMSVNIYSIIKMYLDCSLKILYNNINKNADKRTLKLKTGITLFDMITKCTKIGYCGFYVGKSIYTSLIIDKLQKYIDIDKNDVIKSKHTNDKFCVWIHYEGVGITHIARLNVLV